MLKVQKSLTIKEWCQTVYNVFTWGFNIALCFPKKDKCDLCVAYKNESKEGKQQIQENYEKHIT